MKRVLSTAVILGLILSLFGFGVVESALGTVVVVIDFEEFRAASLGGLGSLQEIGDFYQATGVHFEGATSLSSADGGLVSWLFPPHSGDAVVYDDPSYSGTITITFDSPVNRVGGYFTTNTALTLTAYDTAGNQVDQNTDLNQANYIGSGTGIEPNYYLEVSSSDGIAMIVIEDTGNTYTLDDLTFVAPMHHVTGGGTVDWAGGRVTYGFVAHQVAYPYGAQGEFVIQARDTSERVKANIVSLAVDGTNAWMGGIVTQSNSSWINVGDEFIIRVVDNGEGKKAAPDQVSSMYWSVGSDVSSMPLLALLNWTNGNVQVQ